MSSVRPSFHSINIFHPRHFSSFLSVFVAHVHRKDEGRTGSPRLTTSPRSRLRLPLFLSIEIGNLKVKTGFN